MHLCVKHVRSPVSTVGTSIIESHVYEGDNSTQNLSSQAKKSIFHVNTAKKGPEFCAAFKSQFSGT